MRLVVGIAVALGLAGCITPGIPIPPPDPADMDFTITTDGGTTKASMTYPPDSIYANGTAYIYDRNTGKGVIQACNPDGSVPATMPLPATLGDNIDVTIQLDKQTAGTCIVLQAGLQNPDVYCQ